MTQAQRHTADDARRRPPGCYAVWGGRASRDGLFIGLNRGVMIPAQGVREAEIVQDAWLARAQSQRRFIRSDGLGVTLPLIISEAE